MVLEAEVAEYIERFADTRGTRWFPKVSEVLPLLYLRGLSPGDFPGGAAGAAEGGRGGSESDD